jgi:hypothetical protein
MYWDIGCPERADYSLYYRRSFLHTEFDSEGDVVVVAVAVAAGVAGVGVAAEHAQSRRENKSTKTDTYVGRLHYGFH